MTLQERSRVSMRWMIRRDTPEVLAIDLAGDDPPWDEEDLLRHLRQRSCIGMVTEHEGKVAGFIVYEMHKEQLYLSRVGVAPEMRLQGVFRRLSQKLQEKLSPQRRTRVSSIVNERNMGLLLAMKACGWVAVEVIPGHFDGGMSDGIEMELKYTAATMPE